MVTEKFTLNKIVDEPYSEWLSFRNTLGEISRAINDKSPDGLGYLNIVCMNVCFDLLILTKYYNLLLKHLTHRKPQEIIDSYAKWIKRTFIIEIFSLAETRVREIAEQLQINKKLKGRIAAIRNNIKSTKRKLNLLKIKNTEENEKLYKTITNSLQKVLTDCGGDFVEFKRILTKVMEYRIDDACDRIYYENLYDLLRNLRNAMHSNFIADRNFTPKVKWYQQKFVKGQGINVTCKHCINIAHDVFKFFNRIESLEFVKNYD